MIVNDHCHKGHTEHKTQIYSKEGTKSVHTNDIPGEIATWGKWTPALYEKFTLVIEGIWQIYVILFDIKMY